MKGILGNKKLQARLYAAMTEGHVGNYVFSGPPGVGKGLIARRCAALITGSEEYQYGDIRFLAPTRVEKKGKTKIQNIRAEDLREALHFLETLPTFGQGKVLIIDDAHHLSLTAQNILLKTLEEPRPGVVIFLVTSESRALLETILSRVIEEKFTFVEESELQEVYTDEWMKENSLPLFFRTLGSPALLSEAATSPEVFTQKKELLRDLYQVSRLSLGERSELAKKLAEDSLLCREVLSWWVPGLWMQSKKLGVSGQKEYHRFLEALLESLERIKNPNANIRLVLENLFFSLP